MTRRRSYTTYTGGIGSPVTTYLEHGNTRPREAMLQEIARRLSNMPLIPATRLTLADVYIDLAALTGKSEPHINAAEDLVHDTVYDLEQEAKVFPATRARNATTLVSAYTRQAELLTWRQAIEGKQPEADYDQMLTIATEMSGVAQYDPQAVAEDRLIEFMPVLLAARGQERGSSQWMARTSLEREDNTPSKRPSTSWDVGFSALAGAEAYIQPDILRDIKFRASTTCASKDPHSGVKFMRAQKLGFDDPASIIWSCVNEVETVPQDLVNIPILSSDQLDEIAGGIALECFGAIAA